MNTPAKRIAVAYVRRLAYNREAFSKYNAPELVSQLLAVLKKEGLKDVVNQLQQCKVPAKVEKAWNSRKKARVTSRGLAYVMGGKARQQKVASTILRFLVPLFKAIAPHVKNYDRFLKEVAKDISFGWDTDEITSYWKVERMSTVSMGGGALQGDKAVGGDGWNDPVQYDEFEYDVPDEIRVIASMTLSLRNWPRMMARKYKTHIADLRGFMQTLKDLAENGKALALLGTTLASAAKAEVNKNPKGFTHNFDEELSEFARKDSGNNSAFTFEWTPDGSGKVNKSWFKLTGQGLQVFVDFNVTGKAVDIDYKADSGDPRYGSERRLAYLRAYLKG